MTIYHSGPEDDDQYGPGEEGKNQIIDNHGDEFAQIDADGNLIVNVDDMPRAEKVVSLLRIAASAVNETDKYEVVVDPEVKWAGENDITFEDVVGARVRALKEGRVPVEAHLDSDTIEMFEQAQITDTDGQLNGLVVHESEENVLVTDDGTEYDL